MQSSVSEHQERSQRLQQEMGRRLQEKEQTIKTQREQVTTHSHSQLLPPAVIMSGEEARQPLFRISCICYTGSECAVLRCDNTVCFTGATVTRKLKHFLE